MVAGAAAALTGSAYLASSLKNENTTVQCDDGNQTVVGMLRGISASIKNIEATLGTPSKSSRRAAHGIDVVLGAQWGDEGKGKLVDMLSQVRTL
jgi:adenylosuccinate synthase